MPQDEARGQQERRVKHIRGWPPNATVFSVGMKAALSMVRLANLRSDWATKFGRSRIYILLLVSIAILQIGKFATVGVAARILGPTAMGSWQLLALLAAYGVLLTGGIPNAINRELPATLQAAPTIAASMVTTTQTVVLLAAGILVLIGTLMGAVTDIGSLITGGAAGLFAAASLQWLFIEFLLRARMKFQYLALTRIVLGLSFPIICIPMTLWFGLIGFIGGQCVALLIGSSIAIFGRSAAGSSVSKGQFDTRIARQLLIIGIPIMMSGFVATLQMTAERWVVSWQVGLTATGLLTPSILAWGFLIIFPRTLAHQEYPRFAAEFRGIHSTRSKIIRALRRQVAIQALLVVPTVIVSLVLFPIAITRVLPQYSGGIPAMQVTIAGLLLAPLWMPASMFVQILQNPWVLVVIQTGSAICGATASLILVTFGHGLVGATSGTLIGFGIFSGACLAQIARFLRRNSAPNSKPREGTIS